MDQHNSVSSLAGLQITLGPLDRPYMHTVRFVNTFDWAWKVTKRGRIENSSKHGARHFPLLERTRAVERVADLEYQKNNFFF